MWGMAGVGSVVTVSSRLRPDAVERMARARIARHGVAQLAAEASNWRQLRLLHEVRDQLAADPDLDVFYGERPDGYSYLTAYPAGQRRPGIMGEPNGAENPEDYFAAPGSA
jgi:hypothetical protein